MNNKNFEFYENAFKNTYLSLRSGYEITEEETVTYGKTTAYRSRDKYNSKYLDYTKVLEYHRLDISLDVMNEGGMSIEFSYNNDVNELEFSNMQAEGKRGLEFLINVCNILREYGVEMPNAIDSMCLEGVSRVTTHINGDIGQYTMNCGTITTYRI